MTEKSTLRAERRSHPLEKYVAGPRARWFATGTAPAVTSIGQVVRNTRRLKLRLFVSRRPGNAGAAVPVAVCPEDQPLRPRLGVPLQASQAPHQAPGSRATMAGASSTAEGSIDCDFSPTTSSILLCLQIPNVSCSSPPHPLLMSRPPQRQVSRRPSQLSLSTPRYRLVCLNAVLEPIRTQTISTPLLHSQGSPLDRRPWEHRSPDGLV